MKITREIVSDYLSCPYKAYLDLNRQRAGNSEYEKLLEEINSSYRQRALESLSLVDSFEDRPCLQVEEIVDCSQQILTNVVAESDRFRMHFDAIKKTSICNNDEVACSPILFLPDEDLLKRHKVLGACYSTFLNSAKGLVADHCEIYHGKAFKKSRIPFAPYKQIVNKSIADIHSLQLSENKPRIRLDANCAGCRYELECIDKCVDMDTLSLLRGLKGKEIEKLNKKGIFTVTQYAYTYRPRRQRKKRHEGNAKHDYALQSLAIRDNKTYVFSKPDLPQSSLKIFVDVESVPYANFYYLIGVLLIEEKKSEYVYFWANDAGRQGEMWLEFLRFLKPINKFTILHYGSFEARFFKHMANEHDGYSDVAEKVISNSHNVLSDIYGHIYYPSYSKGLKSIAKLLGHSWPTDNPTWVENFQWWHAWNDSRANHLKNKIVEYNRNDCLALKTVFDDLVKITKAERIGLSEGYEQSTEIKTDLPFERARMSFPSQAVEKIRKCAYFDYQMSKVNIGKSGRVKTVGQGKAVPVCELKTNKTITHYQPRRCVVCQSPKIRLDKECSKVLCDLYIGNDIVKKYTVKHSARSFFCNSCKKHFLPKKFKSIGRSKFGWNLQSWAVYKLIRLMNSYSEIADEAWEFFSYDIGRNIKNLKRRFANTYKSTYLDLIDAICTSDLLHVDETYVSVKGRRGYVWIFSNYNLVVYYYTETREGRFLKEMLKNFSGVLISDFYSVYDSIDCPQQKCLIHLIRKINDDVFRNPFDDELKSLAKSFSELLKPIIETIDEHGLDKTFLQNHIQCVEEFFVQLELEQFDSKTAKTHVKRILKNRRKLFTFLNYSNVSWNNNLAEHAVKRFVYLRKRIGGSSTQRGIEEYLVLLSICETLRLNNLSFLNFLKTQETDLSSYIRDNSS